MFQATRRRLALWYTIVTAVLLLLFIGMSYLYVRTTLIERIDDTLNHVVEVVQRSLVIEPVNFHQEGGELRVNVEASFPNQADAGEDDHIDLEWFSPDGDLIWSTLAEPLGIPLHSNPSGETVHVVKGEGVLRQVTQRVQIGRQTLGYLRVSHPWFEVTKPIQQLILDLSLGTVLVIVAVGAIGWFLSGLAMEPVRDSYQRLKQFTADASHELRNPIATIQTNVQVALADPDPDPQFQQHQLQVVERLTRRLGRLVDDLLFLARQDSGMVQPKCSEVLMEDLLKDVLEEQQLIALEKQVYLSLQIQEQPSIPIKIVADRDQMARLFTNLIANAVQYTSAGGQVQVMLQRSGKSIQVKVQDTGMGIPEEALPQIFDRFYRVDPARTHHQGEQPQPASGTGSGLGLAIVDAIVENHQGQIQVESKLNLGTTFTVLLPV
ncbi:two-component sensor histidine kinase [Leptolyngbya sp. 'hensonii']|nr:ATP-binding protein [Leptolyngbya sp. 'hensonii']OLP18365.1 two-component sensor histidine kinase [Leptolyngbya sp. 'hensonii']